MKNLGLTLGLTLGLLLCVMCCTALPYAIPSGICCFKFFTGRVPNKQIISITKTDSRCVEKAFRVHTAAGKMLCVAERESWVLKAFNDLQDNRAK